MTDLKTLRIAVLGAGAAGGSISVNCLKPGYINRYQEPAATNIVGFNAELIFRTRFG